MKTTEDGELRREYIQDQETLRQSLHPTRASSCSPPELVAYRSSCNGHSCSSRRR